MDAVREWISWFGAVLAALALLIAALLVVAAAALLLGFWPVALLIAAGAFFAFAKWAAGVKD